MNDHDAMTAINEALEHYFRGQLDPLELIRQVTIVSGQNLISHQEAGQQ